MELTQFAPLSMRPLVLLLAGTLTTLQRTVVGWPLGTPVTVAENALDVKGGRFVVPPVIVTVPLPPLPPGLKYRGLKAIVAGLLWLVAFNETTMKLARGLVAVYVVELPDEGVHVPL
jgi:hypothetical protein